MLKRVADLRPALSWLALSVVVACQPAAQPPASAPTPAAAPSSSWHEDAPDAAFGSALHEGQLVLADLWAPWCHTCLSMQAHVLKPELVPELRSLTLLTVDTERASNSAFLAEYPVGVWPTFYLLDPKTRSVRGRWLGAATPAELSRWLTESSRDDTGAEQLSREADALAAKRALADAAAHYRAALAAAPASWPRRSTTLVSLISMLSKQKLDAACLELALAELGNLPASVGAVDFASTALGCADRAPQDVNAAKLRALAAQTLARDCSTLAPGAAVDDRADACGNLRHVQEALADRAGAVSAAEQALAVIAAGSANAPPEQQAIYDWERSSNLVFLGRSAEAESLLLERERQLPNSYNPPHYLARIYRDSQRWDPGLSAIERALTKAYGPRRVGLLGIKAELLKGKGQLAQARQVLEEQLTAYRALPAGQQQPDAELAAQRRLDTWTD